MKKLSRPRSWLVIVVVMAATAGLGANPAGAATAWPQSRVVSFPEMIANEGWWLATGQNATRPAPGVNNWACHPSVAHPQPVILLHGLMGNQYNAWAYLGPTIANAGYCVFSMNYGGPSSTSFFNGLGSVARSGAQVNAFIDRVRTATGAAKVNLVGHSEGGFMVEYVPKMVPGAASKVNRVVALAPPTRSTTISGLVPLADLLGLHGFALAVVQTFGCQACVDISPGPVLTQFNAPPIAATGVRYTVIATAHDPVVTPPSSSFIYEPNVQNILVQDVCASNLDGHGGLAFDPTAAALVLNGLDPGHPRPVPCTFGFPI